MGVTRHQQLPPPSLPLFVGRAFCLCASRLSKVPKIPRRRHRLIECHFLNSSRQLFFAAILIGRRRE